MPNQQQSRVVPVQIIAVTGFKQAPSLPVQPNQQVTIYFRTLNAAGSVILVSVNGPSGSPSHGLSSTSFPLAVFVQNLDEIWVGAGNGSSVVGDGVLIVVRDAGTPQAPSGDLGGPGEGPGAGGAGGFLRR